MCGIMDERLYVSEESNKDNVVAGVDFLPTSPTHAAMKEERAFPVCFGTVHYYVY